MGKISPQRTSKHLDLDGIEGHYGALDGYTVGFGFSALHEDPAPLFTGLSDNVCQAALAVVMDATLVRGPLVLTFMRLTGAPRGGQCRRSSPARPRIHPRKRHRAGPGGPTRDRRQRRSGLMGALIFLLIFVALDLVAIRWGVDTRTSNDPRDRYWWPNG